MRKPKHDLSGKSYASVFHIVYYSNTLWLILQHSKIEIYGCNTFGRTDFRPNCKNGSY